MSRLKDCYEYIEMHFAAINDENVFQDDADRLQECLWILWTNMSQEERLELGARKAFRIWKEIKLES